MKILVMFLLVVGTSLYSKDLKLNEAEEIERFYYNKGYEEGYGKAYKEGYEKAYMDFRKKLRKYKSELKAVEAGKYLYEEGKLRYPKVYRVRGDDGSYTVKIVPPKIQGELALKELAKIPEEYISDGGSGEWDENAEKISDSSKIIKKKKKGWLTDVVNSFKEVGEEREEDVEYSASKNLKSRVSVLFEKNEDLMDAVNRTNLAYESKGRNRILVKFANDDAYKSFCDENFDGECR
jgi:hypothetical protein